MKKVYQLLLLFIGSSIISNAQSQSPVQNNQHLKQAGHENSVLFTNDVIIAPSAKTQRGTSISVAFNGWVYEATGVQTLNSDSSGGIVRRSKDNGYTWTTIASYLYPSVDYLSPEIEVAGTDTNSLSLFIAGAWYDSTTSYSDVWVDKYDARTGLFVQEVYNESVQYAIRDIDLATDYRSPAWLASPYSVGLLYSHFGSVDSLIFVSSGDGGNTWGNRQGVAGTTGYMDQVSLAFGISGSWGNGRYFAAWEERSSYSATSIGKIKVAHCMATFNGTWTVPFRLDSLDASVTNYARRPRIACLYNAATDNDSSAISVDVIFERATNGDTANCDILGFYSKSQPLGNYWYRFDVATTGSQTLQPDIAFDPGYNNFLLTYFDRTAPGMPYVVHGYNMVSPSSWILITNNYCDQPSSLKNPFPRVAINPALAQAAFSWTSQATATREQAMFDAEYMVTSVQAASASEENFKLYPNPAQEQTLLTFNLEQTEKVHIDIYDMSGQLVMNVCDQAMNEGPQQISVPVAALSNGTYLLSMTTGSTRMTTRLVVAN